MGLPYCVRVQGVATARPSVGGFTPPTAGDVLPLDSEQTYDQGKATGRTVTETVSAPYVVPLEGVTKVRFFGVKVCGGTLTLLLTSGAGTDQVLTVSDEILLSCPELGSELTGIKMYAPAGMALEVRYMLAGDTA